MRRVELPGDRLAVQSVLRRLLRAGGPAYTVHPGELDWWWYHDDPRYEPTVTWFDEHTVVDLYPGRREVSAFGDLLAAVELAVAELGPGPISIGWISQNDPASERMLDDLGFAPGAGMPVFERPVGQQVGQQIGQQVGGFTIRPLAGEQEATSRADAARSAFASTMEPEMHRARYRQFMASPGYVAARDVVAVDRQGTVGAFAVWWGDDELGLAQFEPVGTHVDFQGRGLGRAVLERCMADMAAAGMVQVRVCTDDDRLAASRLYEAVGFTRVDHLRWWAGG